MYISEYPDTKLPPISTGQISSEFHGSNTAIFTHTLTTPNDTLACDILDEGWPFHIVQPMINFLVALLVFQVFFSNNTFKSNFLGNFMLESSYS